MAAPLSIPSLPTPVSSLRRAISSLRFVRSLLGIPGEKTARASAVRDPEPDTSLTQAELEVLK